MKFTLSWLKDHLDTAATLDQIVDGLTRIGLEVEGVHNPGEALAPFRVARVLSAERHPQADKLQVLSVDAGDGPLQVVCGAPNARAGLVGVFGAPGAYVPGLDVTLKVAAIAYDCGFGDLSHFNRAFRRRFGETPRAVRGAGETLPAAGPGREPTLVEALARVPEGLQG